MRNICKIYGLEKISNKELYQRTEQKDQMTTITQRRLRWLGHTLEDQNNITKKALKWSSSEGKRNRGTPKETRKRTIDSNLKAKERPGIK